MQRRWIGIGWTLALLALLGHVAGADCCLIRDAVRETLDRTAPTSPGAHACCAGSGAATAPATAGEDAPLPDCCGVDCAPTATLEAVFALAAPANPPAIVTFQAPDVPPAPSVSRPAFAPGRTGSPPGPAGRAVRGRAPPIG